MSDEGLFSQPGHFREDLRLLELAVRRKWIVPEQVDTALPLRLLQLALATTGDPRVAINAAKIIVSMIQTNIDNEVTLFDRKVRAKSESPGEPPLPQSQEEALKCTDEQLIRTLGRLRDNLLRRIAEEEKSKGEPA